MVSQHVFSQLVLLALLWLFVIVHLSWPKRAVTAPAVPPEPEPVQPKRSRSHEPKPFEGLTQKPHCALCARDTAYPKSPPPVPPDPMAPTHRRPREVDTSMHFCPHSYCDYRGWLGLGNLRRQRTSYHLSTPICQFFTLSARLAHDEFGLHHSRCDDAAWPQEYAAVGRQYCVKPGHGAAPLLATS